MVTVTDPFRRYQRKAGFAMKVRLPGRRPLPDHDQAAGGGMGVTLPHEDLVSSVLALQIVTAMYFDGRAHVLGLPDSFFTPWHGFLYGGLLLMVGWLVVLSRLAARRLGVRRFAVVPAGYRQAMAGAMVFALGGVADMVWHQVFGVEFGIDALLSPTHLALFVGGSLLFSGPVRAVRLRGGASGPLGTVPAGLSVAAIGATAAFALSFLSGFLSDQAAYALSRAPEGTVDHIVADALVSAGLGSYIVTSLVIVVPLTLMLRLDIAWPGAVFFLVTSLAVLASALADFPNAWVIVAGAVAGGTAEIVLASLRRRGTTARARELVLAPLLPLLLWPGQLLAVAASGPVRWSAAMIAGVVILSSALSFAAVLVLGLPERQHGAMKRDR